ncbi:MAG TPA: antibiotic biosynthesis monooxygenase [Thermomicrobiales bacterium]|nr:antibiotic biosynthesis monooxygenase [Thermomicrobiales bacterium]
MPVEHAEWRSLMFARVSYERYPPEHHAAAIRIVLKELLPVLQRAPGCRGCLLLADGKPGAGLTLVLWETEEAADAASADRGAVAAQVKLAALGQAIESRKIYEVVAQMGPGAIAPQETPSQARSEESARKE